MKKVYDFITADTGENVLMSPGKADNFVGKYRAQYKKFVVLKNQFVNSYVNFFTKQTSAYLLDFVGGNSAYGSENLRFFPFVVEKLYRCVFTAALIRCHTKSGADLLFAQRLMCSQRNQTIDGLCLLLQAVINDFEYITYRSRTGIVGNYQQNSFTGIVVLLKELGNCFTGLTIFNITIFILSFNYHYSYLVLLFIIDFSFFINRDGSRRTPMSARRPQ